MAKCKDVAIIQTTPDIEARKNKDELKQTRYDSSVIKDSHLENLLLKDSETTAETFKELFDVDSPVIPFKSTRDKARDLQWFGDTKEVFGPQIGEVKAEELRPFAIAIAHLQAAAKSEADLISGKNLNNGERGIVTHQDTGLVQTSYSNLARTIGRDILKSRGIRLVPKTKEGIKKSVQMETQIGSDVLQNLEKKGAVTVTTSGSVVNRGFIKENSNGKPFRTGKVVSEVKTVVINPLYKSPTNESEKVTAANIDNRLKATVGLLLPQNAAVPFTSAQPVNPFAQDMEMTSQGNEILTNMQKSPLRMTSFAKGALEHIMSVINDSKNTRTRKTLQDVIKSLNNGDAASPYVFGTSGTQEDLDAQFGAVDAFNEDIVGKEQEFGRSNSKVLQFVRINDDWDVVSNNDLYYTFQTANQNRAHTIQQTLSYQSDNFLSRHILGSPELQTLTNEDTE